MLAVRGLRAEDIRWVARTARSRGDAAVTRDALLALVFAGQAKIEEARLVRELTDRDPARPVVRLDNPPRSTTPEVAPDIAGDGPRMVLSRDHAHGLPVARLIDAGAPDTGSSVISPWRPGWEGLPRSLTDQLSVCVLTRVARVNGVLDVSAAEPSTERVAAAVSAAVVRTVEGGCASPGMKWSGIR